MENFSEPKVRYMFPQLRAGQIATAFLPETRIQLIAGDDIGTFAGAAFADPEKYNGRIIDLAAETLTMGQIAAILSKELGREIQALAVSPEEAVRRGLAPGWVRTQELRNEAGYNADQRDARSFDIPLTTFAQWVRQHRDRIITEH